MSGRKDFVLDALQHVLILHFYFKACLSGLTHVYRVPSHAMLLAQWAGMCQTGEGSPYFPRRHWR